MNFITIRIMATTLHQKVRAIPGKLSYVTFCVLASNVINEQTTANTVKSVETQVEDPVFIDVRLAVTTDLYTLIADTIDEL